MFKSPEGRNRNEGGKKEIGRGERKEEGKKEGKGVKKGCRGSLKGGWEEDLPTLF